jgi:hypothetical protein
MALALSEIRIFGENGTYGTPIQELDLCNLH